MFAPPPAAGGVGPDPRLPGGARPRAPGLSAGQRDLGDAGHPQPRQCPPVYAELLRGLPEVQEAHALTGEMDYVLKVVTRDLKSLSEFVNDVLLPHESVQHVKTAIVLENAEGRWPPPASDAASSRRMRYRNIDGSSLLLH